MTTLHLPPPTPERVALARAALLFICGNGKKSAEVAQTRMRDAFGLELTDAELTAAKLQIISEAISVLARRGQP